MGGTAATRTDYEVESVDLIVTSPPFLNVVDYKQDNWLRAWFCGHDLAPLNLRQTRDTDQWRNWMGGAFAEWNRVLKMGGALCFEVGEIAARKVSLECEAIAIGFDIGFAVECVVINSQNFTKTAHLWGVTNGARHQFQSHCCIAQNVKKWIMHASLRHSGHEKVVREI